MTVVYKSIDQSVDDTLGLQLSWLERTPDKREVGGSIPPKPIDMSNFRGISSIGRAPALQAGGYRFDPGILQNMKITKLLKKVKLTSQ